MFSDAHRARTTLFRGLLALSSILTVGLVTLSRVSTVNALTQSAGSHVLWGVDSIDNVSSQLGATQTVYGRPQFWGQYLVKNDCDGRALQHSDVVSSFNAHIAVLAIDNSASCGQRISTYAQGQAAAKGAVNAARAIGMPAGVAIFEDIETWDPITTAFVRGFYDEVASTSHYLPGFYGNTITGAFQGAYCGAVAADAAYGRSLLWVSEPSLFRTGPGNMPTWRPDYPNCAAHLVAWQYALAGHSGPIPPNVDVDQYVAGGEGLWTPSRFYSDGTFVTHRGLVYRLAGGAPIFVSSWAVFGGLQPRVHLTDAQWNALLPYPIDGTFLCGHSATSRGGAFVVAGGAPVWISNFAAMGGPPPRCLRVDQFAIDHAGGPGSNLQHLRRFPADGTLLCGHTPKAAGGSFVVAGGAPLWVSKISAVGGSSSCTTVDQYAVDFAGNTGPNRIFLQHLRRVPDNGTLLCAAAAKHRSAVYAVAGGAPLLVSHGTSALCTRVDSRAIAMAGSTGPLRLYLRHLHSVPVNGTFLSAGGVAYRVAGGYPLAIHSCSTLGLCVVPTRVSKWVISHLGQKSSHLLSVPVEGTKVQCHPSLSSWIFRSGKWHMTLGGPGVVGVNDTSLSQFPVLRPH